MRHLIVIAAIGALLATGCKPKGCMDKNATNFDAKAKKDNSTCKYEGSVVFWYGKATADSVVANGATSFTYYVDGQLMGSSAANVYWTGAPDCSQASSVTFKKDLGSNKSQSYSYSVKDQSGVEYWKGTVNVNGNECNQLQLTW